ncbi:MAG: hypothetical protein WBM07_12390 [Chitinivibrionales bacterium]
MTVQKTFAGPVVLVCAIFYFAQGQVPNDLNASVTPPSLNAKITIGFNYDLLRPPTDVSFDFAKGYIGVNIPFEQDGLVPKSTADNIWAQMSKQLSQDPAKGGTFQPQASAQQYPNTTIRVDVPMLGGVATFSNIQNVYLDYMNVLGNTNIMIGYDTTMKSAGSTQNIALKMLGAVNVPIEASLGWETMTFGYAYKASNNLVMAFNIHRHIFQIDMLANMDADILGNVKVDQTTDNGGGSAAGLGGLGSSSLSIEKDINYSHQTLYGQASGHYSAEAWSYSFGIQLWRFTETSRFGIDTKAQGSFTANYRLPTFINPQTFQLSPDLTDPQRLISSNMLNDLQQGKTDSVGYSTNEDAEFKLPSGHTLSFDIIPQKIRLSYTKIFGDIQLYHAHAESLSTGGVKKTVDLDVGITLDNVIMLNINMYSAFLNMGVFSMDIRVNDQKHILGNAFTGSLKQLKWGDAAMLPILNLGAALGEKTQLGFELDLLPLPALKTGIIYHF